MHKGHILKFFSFCLFLLFSFVFLPHGAYATNSFINTPATLSTDLGKIPDGQEDLFYHNNIMFYEWCPNGDDGGDTCESVSGSQITWIGDSYSSFLLDGNQYTYDYIEEKLPGVDFGPTKGDSTSYVQGSKFAGPPYGSSDNPNGITILDKLISEKKLRKYLVFALGTNGYGQQNATWYDDVAKKVAAAGADNKVIFVTVRTRDHTDGSGVRVNDAIRKAAENNNNVIIADWVAKVGNDVNKYYGSSDEIHPTSNGLKEWVDLILDSLPSDCGDIITSGDTAEEKVWTGLRRLGFTEAQAAGLMGNIKREGLMNPASWEGAYQSRWGATLRELEQAHNDSWGMGFCGFTFWEHLGNLADIMDAKAPDLLDILQDPWRYSTQEDNKTPYGDGNMFIKKLKEDYGNQKGDEIANRLFSIELIYIHDSIAPETWYKDFEYSHKNQIGTYSGFLGETTVQGATEWWLDNYEHAGVEARSERIQFANDFYNQFKDLQITPISSNSNSSNSSSNTSDSSSSNSAGNNKDYNGDQILSDDEMALLEENKSFYQKSAEKYGFSWQLLAVLHRREHGMARDNPSNGQGPFQFYSADSRAACTALNGASFSAGALNDTEFQKHVDCAADFVVNHYGDSVDLTTDDGVKEMFFRYNGVAGVYKQQALDLGFDQHGADIGEGSPYVMNKADEKRDPNKNPTGWGQIKTDGGGIEYPANQDHGAFVIYQALGGGNGSTSTPDECDGGNDTKCTNQGTKIAEMATSMAWSIEEGKTHQTTPIDKQKEVQDKIQGAGVNYTDCGKFAAAAVIESGADPDFPKGVTGTILAYLQKSDKWEEVKDWNGDESKLQDGDFLVKDDGAGNGHAMIYTGKTSESKGGTWTDASLNGHVGIVRNYTDSSYTSTFHAFRIKGSNNCNLSGGLTDEQAQKLADYYNSSAVTVTGFANKNNCVGFSAFFVSWLTDLSNPNENPTSGDGYAVAGNLISKFSLPKSEGPKAFSVFSTSNASFHSSNHTGVVVRVNDDGTATTVEAACNNSCDGGDGWGMGFPSNTGNAYVWKNVTLPDGLTYAYFDDHINTSKLNEIINK